MDRDRFDVLAKTVATLSTRRSVLALVPALGLAGGLAVAEDAEAHDPLKKCKKKSGKQKKRCIKQAKQHNAQHAAETPSPPSPVPCPPGEKSCQGTCIPTDQCCGTCPQNQVCCTNVGECKDVRNDDDFCGQCANGQCPSGAFCANGACGLTCVQNGTACFGTTCFCGSRVDPNHSGQLVCAEISPSTCDTVTTCNTDADCAPATLGFRQVCVSGLCTGKNVCADPCA